MCTYTSNQNMIHMNFKLSRSAIVSLEMTDIKLKSSKFCIFRKKKIKEKKNGFAVSLQSKKVFFGIQNKGIV